MNGWMGGWVDGWNNKYNSILFKIPSFGFNIMCIILGNCSNGPAKGSVGWLLGRHLDMLESTMNKGQAAAGQRQLQ